jgi:hypothetical protein
MKQKAKHLIDTRRLRNLAEQHIFAKPETVAVLPNDEKRLIHELQVHQIELEMLLLICTQN